MRLWLVLAFLWAGTVMAFSLQDISFTAMFHRIPPVIFVRYDLLTPEQQKTGGMFLKYHVDSVGEPETYSDSDVNYHLSDKNLVFLEPLNKERTFHFMHKTDDMTQPVSTLCSGEFFCYFIVNKSEMTPNQIGLTEAAFKHAYDNSIIGIVRMLEIMVIPLIVIFIGGAMLGWIISGFRTVMAPPTDDI